MGSKLDKHQKIENKSVFEQMFLNNLIKIIKSQSSLNGGQQISKVISEINNNSFLSKISIDWEKYLPIFFHYLDQMKKLLKENIKIVKDLIDYINIQNEFGFNLNQLEDYLTNLKRLLKELEDNYLSKLESLDDFNYITFREKIGYLDPKFKACLDSFDNYDKFSENNNKMFNYFFKISNSTWTPYLTFCKDEIDKLFNDKNINFYKGIFYIYVNRDALNKGFNESILSIVALFIRQAIEDSSFDENEKFNKENVKNIKLEKIKFVLEKIHTDKLELNSKNIWKKGYYNSLKEKLKIIFNNKKENYKNIFSIINNIFNEYIHRNIKIEPSTLKEVFCYFYAWLHSNGFNSDNFQFTMYYYLFIYKIFMPHITIPNKSSNEKYCVSEDNLYIIDKINKNKSKIQDEMNKFVQEIINKISDDLVLNNQYFTNKETKQLWNNFKLNKDKYFDWEKDSIEVLFTKYQVLNSGIINLINNSISLNIDVDEVINQSSYFCTIGKSYKNRNFIEIVDQFQICYQVTEYLLSMPFLFILYTLLLDKKITKEEMDKALNYTLFII